MTISFEQTLIDVWRQVLVENADVVVLDKKRYPVWQTSKRHLREVTFAVDGIEIRGLNKTRRRNLGGQQWLVLGKR
jgi:hypothetical protein